MSKFYNPKIEKVSVTVEGKTNQIYAHDHLSNMMKSASTLLKESRETPTPMSYKRTCGSMI